MVGLLGVGQVGDQSEQLLSGVYEECMCGYAREYRRVSQCRATRKPGKLPYQAVSVL